MPRSDDLHQLPADLPVPVDDGACAHLPGLELPDLVLPSTSGAPVRLTALGAGWTVLYAYPRTGQPDADPPGGLAAWDSIPGIRGCTPQACAYRDLHGEIAALGARVVAVSTQSPVYQLEMATRLHLPFEVLSDERLELTRALTLPTFTVAGLEVIRRLTLFVRDRRIEQVVYPVFPPDADAERALDWLRRRSA